MIHLASIKKKPISKNVYQIYLNLSLYSSILLYNTSSQPQAPLRPMSICIMLFQTPSKVVNQTSEKLRTPS